MIGAGAAIAFLLFATVGSALADQPVGLVLTVTGDAKITRPGRDSQLDAIPGRELFSGDQIRPISGSVTFSFCPDKTARTLAVGGQALLGPTGLSSHSAPTQQKSIETCVLPEMERFPLAPQTPRRNAPREGTLEQQIARLSPEAAQTVRTQLAKIDAALQEPTRDPANQPVGLLSARAVALANAGLIGEAEAQYDAIFQQFSAAWTQHVAAKLESDWEKRRAQAEAQSRGITPANRDPGPPVIKKTYAIVIGISQYDTKSNIPWLNYAANDAKTFAEFLGSPRGGNLRLCTPEQPVECEVQLLTDGGATLANITRVFDYFVKDHAQKDNGLIVFIAGHGADPATELSLKNKTGIEKRPIILTYDSDYNEAKITGYIMDELRNALATHGLLYGRVVLFADVCHAGDIGPIAGTSQTQPAVEQVFHLNQGSVGLFMASQGIDDAYESDKFGGGHGAFTYSVLEGLNQGPDAPPKNLIFFQFLSQIQQRVADLTGLKQISTGVAANQRMVFWNDLSGAGLPSFPAATPISDPDQLRRPRGIRPSAPKVLNSKTATPSNDDFIAAVQSNRLRHDEGPGNAQDILDRLKPTSPALYAAHRDQLRAALEDRGQQTILAYLRGDQLRTPPTDFDRCAKDFAAAVDLEPGMLYDRSRGVFCSARFMIYRSGSSTPDYATAERLFQRAIDLDPNRSYAYNGLGIAYLEQAARDVRFYDLAIAAFRDATHYSPYWPYPWHNLALTYEQKGLYAEAIDAYQTAMKQSPEYGYLPLNLGLLYQRLNRTQEAEAMFRKALKVGEQARDNKLRPGLPGQWTERAEVWNALGNLQSDQGDYKNAEVSYRNALADDPRVKSARHDLALLLSRKQPSSEAEGLWTGILKEDASYTPSLLSFAAYLEREHRDSEAAQQYAAALSPGDAAPGIRRRLAQADIRLKQYDSAIDVLQPALSADPSNPRLLEEMADLYVLAGQPGKAAPLFSAAYRLYLGSADKRRIGQKQTASAPK